MSLERGTAKLSDLKAAPYNPRKISPAALKGLQASIERFGVVQDIVVNRRSGFVVGGHQRVAALKVAGVKEVPVCWVDLDEPEEKALNVALNNPHISGEFDDSLQALLAEIQDGIGPDLFKHVALDSLLLSEAELGSFSVEETTMPTLDSGDKHAGKTNGGSSMSSFRNDGGKPLPGFQLRYIYFLNPAARSRLTVPVLPFSDIAKAGAGMYLGKQRVRSSETTGHPPEEQQGSTDSDAPHA